MYPFHRETILDLDTVVCPGDQGAPAIIMCHGYGTSAGSFAYLADLVQFENIRPTWIFPNGIEPLNSVFGRGWFPLNVEKLRVPQGSLQGASAVEHASKILAESTIAPVAEKIDNLVQETRKKHPKVFLGGFSQGCMLSAHIGLSSKRPPDGLILLSGAFVENQNWEELAKSQSIKTPFLLAHGKEDFTLPYPMGERLYQLLISNGFSGTLLPFTGIHEVPSQILSHIRDTLSGWMNS